MFNLLSTFNEFEEVIELLNINNFPSKIRFIDQETNNSIEILITLPNNNDINFNIKFFNHKKKVNIIQLNKSSILFFQNQYYQYIKQFLPMKMRLADPLQKKYKSRDPFSFFKLSWKIINEYKKKPFFFYPFSLLNIYSIDDYDNGLISRTIMKSFHRVNIVNNSYVNKTNNFLEIHKLNIVLIDHIFQNRIRLILKMLNLGTKFFIRFVRIHLFIIWIISNITIIFTNGNSDVSAINVYLIKNLDSLYNSVILPFSSFLIVNITIPIIWSLAPRIIRYLIGSRIQKRIDKLNE